MPGPKVSENAHESTYDSGESDLSGFEVSDGGFDDTLGEE